MISTDIEHEIYQKVILGVNNRRNNEITAEFSIPDLFTPAEWDSYPKQPRLTVCKHFKAKVDLAEINKVVYCRQNEKDWAIYKIVI